MRLKFAVLMCLLCQPAGAQQPSVTLAPTGTLRAVFLGGNPVQGRVDARTGTVTGPVPDLVREMARKLGVASTIIPAADAAGVIDALKSGMADIGFLAYDDTRARDVDFGAPFAVMLNSYLVKASSPIRGSADVDRPGVTVAAVKGQTQELFVSRRLKNARVRVFETMPSQADVESLLTTGDVDAFAINRQRSLEAEAASGSRLRALPDSFLDVDQCFVVARGGRAKLEAIERFMAGIRATGFVKSSIERARLTGVGVAGADAVPFKIRVPDAVLTDLKQRLARTRFPSEIPGSGWDYGTSLAYLKELVTYWRTTFDWRAAERRLNQLDQFTTNIDGVVIHFVHQRSRNAGALPIVLTHGWPGSFVEFTKVIGPLTDPAAHGGRPEDAFHVVAISLPGFGFSGKPTDRGYGPERIAGIISTLMARLGYRRYAVQGGDWGSSISRFVAINDAEHVAGLHSNFCLAGPPAGVSDPNEGVPPAEIERMRARQAFFDGERGYFQIQSTKPQTIGYALDDSPAGLAAWIVEKFRSWCDCGGDVETKFTKDDLLTNITLYWATETATSSARIYYENQRAAAAPARKVTVPTACAVFPKEINIPPRRWVEASYNLTRWTEMPRGGHFAALEEPELLVDDIRAFFRSLR